MKDAFDEEIKVGCSVIYATNKSPYGTVYVTGKVIEAFEGDDAKPGWQPDKVMVEPEKCSVPTLLPFKKPPSVYACNCVVLR